MSGPVSGEPVPAIYNLHPLPTKGSERCQRVISCGTSRLDVPRIYAPSRDNTARSRSQTRRGMRSDLDFTNTPDEECLQALQVSDPRMEFHLMIKCLNMFTEKVIDTLWHDRQCCGEHSRIIEECINSYRFRSMLDDCLERVNQLWTTQNTINVVCCDYEGTRESVAMASIMCDVLEIKGCRTAGPYHICKGRWHEKAICSNCWRCRSHEEKIEMFSAVASSL